MWRLLNREEKRNPKAGDEKLMPRAFTSDEWVPVKVGVPIPSHILVRRKLRRGKRYTLDDLQRDVRAWSEKNFGGTFGSGYRPLLGAVEELGELAHAHLKAEQKIRTDEDHEAQRKDAIGDLMIYLLDYCANVGVSITECIMLAWKEVRQRDWKKNSATGKSPSLPGPFTVNAEASFSKPSPPRLKLSAGIQALLKSKLADLNIAIQQRLAWPSIFEEVPQEWYDECGQIAALLNYVEESSDR